MQLELTCTAVSNSFQNISTRTTVTIDIELITDIIVDVYSSVVDPHHFYSDPDSDFYLARIWIHILASKYRLKPLKKCSNRLILYTFWLVICKLMRSWLLLDTDPDFYCMRIRMRIQVTKMMRMYVVPDPQHWHSPLGVCLFHRLFLLHLYRICYSSILFVQYDAVSFIICHKVV
jgi:hypothetical protein